ncbi:sigma 54-interacting transcriptional regulator [Clostridium ganghwense]|uniref:HTH-type transcriptional regulatory protein TyrR n=1 Tax=Clostridium ganghwense TaxID=312089 RepID=A0ABT4CMR4_9CLOT|nr:sigma 54-interacting transcriptional regulator [Clostridium ganghwense]MCY6369718.1 sigma 54-interacting transcriptional regulator [Clostridium ganghwense]
MEISRLEIKTIDRPNMTYDISAVFVKYKINIIWMEVYTFVIYIKFAKLEPSLQEKIKKEILNIDGVQEIKEINLISVEEKEIEIKTIMDTVCQGIVVLNKDENIKYINKYALKNIFSIKDIEVINKKISVLLSNYHNKVKKALENVKKYNKIVDLEIEINNKNYLLSTNSIISEENILCGFIITLQDTKRMNKIFNLKRYDNQITFNDIVGKSFKIIEAINHAKIFSQSDSSVLIMGESGTGKEIFARSIHNLSRRSSMPFVAINCGAIPDQLLESELFGYEGGSFTGAKNNGKMGIFEVANGGTVFLDEIGEMPPHLQVKLLRVLQEKKIRKLGSNKEIDIDVRIISATNKDLNVMVESNQFRLDLFYRINIFTLIIPPLRERKEDIKVLAEYYVKQFSKEYNKKINEITPNTLKKLLNYEWYGNVRELQNVIERAVALSYTERITEQDIKINNVFNKDYTNNSTSLKETLGKIEKEIIIDALKNHESIRKAAKVLGVTHTLLINRIKKYHIDYSELKH